ncbi:hypothetical protein K438DRAFT_2018329 [Mycena galopus ATCC 62051]|nr:hypothetical protein K438DRAFT_2018329 [Mycena galopus ATCC 62051]
MFVRMPNPSNVTTLHVILSSPVIPSASDDAAELAPKIYKKPMSDKWAQQYNTTHKQRDTSRPDSTAGYRTEKGSTRLQGITTLPKLNIANHPKLYDASCVRRAVDDVAHIVLRSGCAVAV